MSSGSLTDQNKKISVSMSEDNDNERKVLEEKDLCQLSIPLLKKHEEMVQ